MNAMRPEKTEGTETETIDTNLAAVTEVEAGIRDFSPNDIAYLPRPAATPPAPPARHRPARPAARPERGGHRHQRQLADPARRRHLPRRDREFDLRAREP